MSNQQRHFDANGSQHATSGMRNLVAESNHRIANSLSLAAAFLRLQRRKSPQKEVRAALMCAETRLASIGRIHSYLQSQDMKARIDLADYLFTTLPEIGASVGIECLLSVEGSGALEVSGRIATQVTVIVNELALNALKHGYAGETGGCISLEVSRGDDGDLRIHFADGGVGLPAGFELGQCDGLGLQIVSSTVAELGGSISVHSDGGAHFVIRLPAE